jgi:hypothetical protein
MRPLLTETVIRSLAGAVLLKGLLASVTVIARVCGDSLSLLGNMQ